MVTGRSCGALGVHLACAILLQTFAPKAGRLSQLASAFSMLPLLRRRTAFPVRMAPPSAAGSFAVKSMLSCQSTTVTGQSRCRSALRGRAWPHAGSLLGAQQARRCR